MSVKLMKHPSFQQYLIAECAAPSEAAARALVEATARWADCDVVQESHKGPRVHSDAHTWFLLPRHAAQAERALAMAA